MDWGPSLMTVRFAVLPPQVLHVFLVGDRLEHMKAVGRGMIGSPLDVPWLSVRVRQNPSVGNWGYHVLVRRNPSWDLRGPVEIRRNPSVAVGA